MQIADFTLERYFARWEFAVRHVLCASDVEPYRVPELLALADDDCAATLGIAAPRLHGVARTARAARRDRDAVRRARRRRRASRSPARRKRVFLAMHATARRGRSRGRRVAGVSVAARGRAIDRRRRHARSARIPRDWSLDVDAVAAAMRPNTRVIVINFPHSPTGAQLSPEQLRATHRDRRAARRVAVLRRGVSLSGARRAARFRRPRRCRRVRSASA